MSWWKQFLIAASGFFAGTIFMNLWFARNFGQLGLDVPYSLAGEMIAVAIVFLAIAFFTANWSRVRRT